MRHSWVQERTSPEDARRLIEQPRFCGEMLAAVTGTLCCRNPKDHPALTALLDVHADAVVAGNADLRAGGELHLAMQHNGVALCAVGGMLEDLAKKGS